MSRSTCVRLLAALLLAVPSLAAAQSGTVKGTITRGPAPPTPLADAVVMIEGPVQHLPADAPHVTMDQRNETFVPHVLAVAAGTTVDFPNHDKVLHNVSSRSRARKFDLGMYGEGDTRSVRFDEPGVVGIRCQVHPKMSAWIIVHDNGWVAVSDARGNYTIEGIPAGRYDVRVWHEELPERRVTVGVHAGQVDPLNVRLDPTR